MKVPDQLVFKRTSKVIVRGGMLGKLWAGGEAWKPFIFEVDMQKQSCAALLYADELARMDDFDQESMHEFEWDGVLHFEDISDKFPYNDGDFDSVEYFVYTVVGNFQANMSANSQQVEEGTGTMLVQTELQLGEFVVKVVNTVYARNKADRTYDVVPCTPEKAALVLSKMYEAHGGGYAEGN